MFDALAVAGCFSTLDLASGYWQVGLTEDAKEKTAFATSQGLYQFKVLPFGLCNVPSTFERLNERVLQGLRWQMLLVYLDDVIIFSRSIEEHISRLEVVFSKLKEVGLKLKPRKCHFFQREVVHLGHVVSEDGIATWWEKEKHTKSMREAHQGCEESLQEEAMKWLSCVDLNPEKWKEAQESAVVLGKFAQLKKEGVKPDYDEISDQGN